MKQMVHDKFINLLGKSSCPTEACLAVLEGEYTTSQMKEAVSSIGRKRDANNIPILLKYAKHFNPEVSMQAIRGLLVFKTDNRVSEFLTSLVEHPNEMIRDIIHKETRGPSNQENRDHSTCPEFLKNTLVQGDTLHILDYVPKDSIHLTFTSPPYYNAREYSTYSSYSEYLDLLEATFKKLIHVTKEGRFFVLSTSPVIIPRAGRKYSSRRYPVPFDIHARLMEIGWEFIDDIVWVKPEKSAKNRISNFNTHRKPLTYKPNSCTEYLMVYRKKSHNLLDWNLKQYNEEITAQSLVDDSFSRSNVWQIAPRSSKVHSAVFPIELCRQVIKLYSFKNDLVFDPFAGSGTLAVAAIELDRHYFMTEKCEQYVDAISERLSINSLFPKSLLRYNTNEFKQKISVNGISNNDGAS